MREELRDGQWAVLRDHITHGQDKEIRRAQVQARQDPVNHAGDGDTAALRAFIEDWSIKDPAGVAIPLGDPDAVDRMPSDIADRLALLVDALYHPEATVPNAPTPSSSGASSPGSESAAQQ